MSQQVNEVNVNAKTGLPFGVINGSSLHPEVQNNLYDAVSTKVAAQNLADAKVQAVREITSALETFGHLNQHVKDQIAELVEAAGENTTEDFSGEEPSAEVKLHGTTVHVTHLGGVMLVFSVDGPVVNGFQKCSPCIPNAVDLDVGFITHGFTTGPMTCRGFPADWFPNPEEDL